jgi:hypothetical protein
MVPENTPIYVAAFPRNLRQMGDVGRLRFRPTTREVASLIRNGTPQLDAPHKATLLALLRGVRDEDLAVFDTRSTLTAKQVASRIGASFRRVEWHVQNLAAKGPGGPYLLDLTSYDGSGREVYDLWPTFMMLPEMRAAAQGLIAANDGAEAH